VLLKFATICVLREVRLERGYEMAGSTANVAPVTSVTAGSVSTNTATIGAATAKPGTGPVRAVGQRSRLAWLDALRGIAVLFVIYEHVGPYLLTGVHTATVPWFPSGRVGVLLFFLVSGYIIPASLEKRGNVRAFLVSRFFRLYPLYIVALTAVVLLNVYGSTPMDQGVKADIPATVAAHATMLSTMVNVPMALAVTWTLAFEMMFYLLVVSLYSMRLLRGSATIAMGFAAAAILAGPLPLLWITRHLHGAWLLPVTVLVVMSAGLAAVLSRRRWLTLCGAAILILLVLALLVYNEQFVHILDGLSLMAVMFAGSAIYRFHHGQIPAWRALATVLLVAVGEAYTLHEVSPLNSPKQAIGEVVLVFGIFAIVMWWGQRRNVPVFLAWIGGVSYSVYLLHDIVVLTVGPTLARLAGGDPLVLQLCVEISLLLLILGIAALTYRFIELPAQRLGRRVNGHFDRRAVDRAAGTPGRVERSEAGPAESVPAEAGPADVEPDRAIIAR
jgi:peptidoglycan/LPS O-acetylase OafA/YrhL